MAGETRKLPEEHRGQFPSTSLSRFTGRLIGTLKERFSIRRDLGLQLLALYLLFVGPVILATLVFDRLAAQRLEADVKAADLSLARAIAQETNTLMDSALQSVRQLSTFPAVIAADPEGMHQLFQVYQSGRPDVNLVYRLDTDGMMVYHYPTGPGTTVGWDFSFRDYFQLAQAGRIPLMSAGRKSPTTQQLVTTAVMPLWDQPNEFLGVVATNIKLQSLSHTLASIAAEYGPGEGFQLAIIDSAGRIIAHPDPQQLLGDLSSSLPVVTREVLALHSGNLIATPPGGEEMLYSYVPIPSVGWGVVVGRPTAAAFATPRATHRGILITIAIILSFGLLFWLALSRQVIQPLEKLTAYSRSIGPEGNFPSEQRQALENLVRRPDQIGELIHAMLAMEAAIEARLNELSTLLDTSTSVVSSLDPRTVLNRILEQVERLMKIRMCAIVAYDEERGVFRVQASRGLSQRYAEQLAISPGEPYSLTLRALRSGQPVQVSDTEQDDSYSHTRPRARAEGYRSLLAMPLNTQHAPPAALLVYRPDPHVFTNREIALLTNFANHAAMAIENATLFARSDMRLREQTRRLEALIGSLQDGLLLEDLQGNVIYANRRSGELVRLPPEEISGAPVINLMERLLARSSTRAESRAAVQAALDGSGERRVEIVIGEAHRRRYLHLYAFDVTGADGEPIGRGQILRDITQNREIDRMKSSLIATVSHELRTPLAAIKGYVTTLLAEDVTWDPETQHEFLAIISEEADRLSSLVNDLLDMSRIEAGNLTVRYEACDLPALIARAAERAHPRPHGRLQVDLPGNLPVLYADAQRVEVVLRNLIENAAKYSPDETPITVTAAAEHGRLVIRVEDEGPGIPPEESERIFESFYRLENGLARPSPGAGLGLAISQGFVRAHGGEIWLEPRPRGTCITFALPLRPPEDLPEDLPEDFPEEPSITSELAELPADRETPATPMIEE